MPVRYEFSQKNASFVIKDPPLYYDTLYIQKFRKITMKSTQLLSVVFSLIMFTGVTAGNTAFAESDDIDDILEDFCEMTLDERSDILSKYELDDYAEKLAGVCDMDDDVRDDALEEVIDAIDLETFDEDDFDLNDLLDDYCELSDIKKRQFLTDHPRFTPFTERLTNYCDMSEDEQDTIDELIKEHEDKIRTELRDYSKDYRMDYKKDMRGHLDRYCEMPDEDKKAYVAEHDKAADKVEKMNRYCSLDEDSRMDFIEEHKDEYKAHMKDKMHDKMTDKKHMDYDRLCAMTDSDRAAEITDVAKLDRLSKWCDMSTEERKEYKMKHYGTDKPKMMDKKHHMDYERLCDLAESDRALEIDDSEKLDRISDWCEMSTEEREDYKMKHQDEMKDKKHEMKMNFSDKSDRLKAMIMNKHDISDERADEIKMKYIEKHGDLTDKKKSELKMKFKDHMKHMKHNLSDERKSEIHDRLAEMKAFKAELRERSSDMTDEEKQELREEFIEKAKDMQLAWINPRMQMTAGVDSTDVECREGFSLVMKASNGVAMCLKADTALKMIDRGIVVPAN